MSRPRRYVAAAAVEEVPISRIFPQEIVLLTAGTLSKHPHHVKVKKILDELGVASAIAQNLKHPITTYEKMLESNHKLYLAVDLEDDDGNGCVVGFLKLGEKRLFVTDGSVPAQPADVQCILDFYIDTAYQRRGWGKHLFQHAIELENVDPENMAYDRPSEKLISFLAKHYRLTEVREQPNRFVLYRNFFDNIAVKYNGRCGTASNMRPGSGGYLMRRY